MCFAIFCWFRWPTCAYNRHKNSQKLRSFQPYASAVLQLFSKYCCTQPKFCQILFKIVKLWSTTCFAICCWFRWPICASNRQKNSQKLILFCHFLMISLAILCFQPPQKQPETSAVLLFSADVFGCHKQSMDSGVLLKGSGVVWKHTF